MRKRFGSPTTRQRLGYAKQAQRGPTPLVDSDRMDDSGVVQEVGEPRIVLPRPKTARRFGTRRGGRY